MVLQDTTSDRGSPSAHTDAIVAYYDETWLDYRFFWLNEKTLSVHFGYSDETTGGHADSLLNMNRVLADRAGIRQGERGLDAGCGVGGSSFWLAQQRGADVVGITPVGSQVAQAKRFAARRKLTRHVRFEQADYTNTLFPSASFDSDYPLSSHQTRRPYLAYRLQDIQTTCDSWIHPPVVEVASRCAWPPGRSGR
jgi:tocopherol O-methyltransferase